LQSDLHQVAMEQISVKELKKRVRKAEREFRGVDNAKLLVIECEKAEIPYGPSVREDMKVTKAEAIEQLVRHRHKVEQEKKREIEEQKGKVKEAELLRKRMADVERRHTQRVTKARKIKSKLQAEPLTA
jgi:hypothetical protein